jgi:hypothetical protein
VLTPAEAARLQPGDILVTRATDPGWTPVFSIIGGAVLEIGGALSHGAIVAREYGLPAVVNAPQATQRIKDGQMDPGGRLTRAGVAALADMSVGKLMVANCEGRGAAQCLLAPRNPQFAPPHTGGGLRSSNLRWCQ